MCVEWCNTVFIHILLKGGTGRIAKNYERMQHASEVIIEYKSITTSLAKRKYYVKMASRGLPDFSIVVIKMTELKFVVLYYSITNKQSS